MLAARRTSPAALVGRWEFPGGKVEPGESAEGALRRELQEELSIAVELGEELCHPTLELWPASGGYSMRLYWAAAATDAESIALTGSHDEIRWLSVSALHEVDWLDSDRDSLPLVANVLIAHD